MRPFGPSPTMGPQTVHGYSMATGFEPLTPIDSTRLSKGSRPDPFGPWYRSGEVLGSTMIMSPVPQLEFVYPQAIRPVLPATSVGAPGRVTPVSLCPGQARDIRYQMFGTPRCRCMSFATMAEPPAEWSPDTAKLFEPGVSPSSQDALPGVAARTMPAPPSDRLRRMSTSEGGGIGAGRPGLASIGASAGVDSGAKNASDAGPSSSRIAQSVRTYRPVPSCRSSVIANVMRAQSSGSQGRGSVRRTVYSHGFEPRAASPALTPFA